MKIYVPAVKRISTNVGDFYVKSAPLRRTAYFHQIERLNALSDESVSFVKRLEYQAELLKSALFKYVPPSGDDTQQCNFDRLIDDEIIDINIARDILETYFATELWESDQIETDTVLEVYPIGYGGRSKRIAELIEKLPDVFGGQDAEQERELIIELISLCTKTDKSCIESLYESEALSLQTLHACVKSLTSSPEKKMTS